MALHLAAVYSINNMDIHKMTLLMCMKRIQVVYEKGYTNDDEKESKM